MLRLPLVRVGLVIWLFSPSVLAEPGPAPSAVVPPAETPAETVPVASAPAASVAPAPAQPARSAPAAPSPVPYYYVPPVQGMAGVAAQPPPALPPEDLTVYRHDGFFARLSLGVGYENANVDPSLTPEGSILQKFGSGSTHGPAVHSELLLGGTPTPGFVVGSGLMNWRLKKDGRDVEFFVIPLFANYYLDAEGPWFLQGFVGLGSGTLGGRRKSDGTSKGAAGLAVGAGGGWETWVGEQGSLGLALRFVYANMSKDKDLERYSLSFIVPTLSGNFTFH